MEVFDTDRAERVMISAAKISRWKFKDKKLYAARHLTYAGFSTVTVLWADNETDAREQLDKAEHVKGEYTLREEQL